MPDRQKRGPASPGATEIRITGDEFRRFRDFLYRHTGMHFPEGKRYYVDKRLAERIAATNSPSFQSYFALLRSGASNEMERLINRLTVNETYFLREEYQFRCLVADLLPAIAAHKRPDEGIRIWSLPCATGEETYSIAIWLLEHWAEVDRHEVEIIGSDIDTEVLRAAETGLYEARSLSRLSPALLARYFEPAGEGDDSGRRRIIPALRDSVRFARVNLVNPAETAAGGEFDVVFCRNLLIYFDDASRRVAAENLYDCLAPGGYLCLGHSESMSRISSLFAVRRFPDAIVYQKPTAEGSGGAG